MPRGGRREGAGRPPGSKSKPKTTFTEAPPVGTAQPLRLKTAKTVTALKPQDFSTLDLKAQFSLTRREFLFVQVLLTEPALSHGAAYVQAGYKASNSDVACANAARLIGKDRVAKALSAGRALIAERNAVTQDRVLRELARLGFSDPRKVFCDESYTLRRPTEFDDDTAAAINGIEIVTRAVGGEIEYIHKIKFIDKVGPLGLMARHLGMLHDKQSVPDRQVGEIDEDADDGELVARLESLLAKAKHSEVKRLQ